MNNKPLAMIIVFSLVLIMFHHVWGIEPAQSLRFATFNQEHTKLLKASQLPPSFSSNAAWILPMPEQLVVFYQRPHLDAYLSLFDQGQEHVLWKNDHIMDLLGPAMPPVLAEGLLNANDTPDILFCYTEDSGIGQSAAVWEQYLVMFLDGDQQTTPLLLSASDWFIRDDPPIEEGSHGNPATKRSSLVLLSPATSATPCTFSLWSRREVYDHPPTHTHHAVTYHITTYQLKGNQLVMINDMSDTAKVTAQTLRNLVKERRAQGEQPLLLDFTQRPTHYFRSDDEWFGWEHSIDR